jgi:hypothetical protein
MSIFKIASWTSGSPESIESFIRHLPPIFKAANELRIAIGEHFTSADLDISVFDCGRTYDPSYMKDGYPIGIRAPEIIAGTTGIGLKKLMAERGANDTLQFQNVISAKIVLESTLREALEHAQTSGGLRKQKPAGNTDDGGCVNMKKLSSLAQLQSISCALYANSRVVEILSQRLVMESTTPLPLRLQIVVWQWVLDQTSQRKLQILCCFHGPICI